MPWGTKCTRPVCGGMLLAARPYNHKRRAAERVALVVGAGTIHREFDQS